MLRISLLRILVLLSLFMVGFFSLFAIPADDSATWTLDLLLSKGLAFLALWLFHRLYEHWKVVDRLIRAFDKWSTKGMENPNPMCKDR